MATRTFTPDEIMQMVTKGKAYTILLLLTGDQAPPQDEQLAASLQMQHLAHLFQMESEGKSSVFGPMTNDPHLRGLIIFNTTNKEDIHRWMADDPWIKGGYLKYELYDWFGIPGQKVGE